MTGRKRDVLHGPTLVREIETATQLLAVGLNEVTNPEWYASEPAAAFTCLASGVERTLKLTYLVNYAHPSKSSSRGGGIRTFQHHLDQLYESVMPNLRQRASDLNQNYAATLLKGVEADPYWPEIFGALNAWADASGRYRDLDTLIGEVPADDPPTARWEVAERLCIQDRNLQDAICGPGNREALNMVRLRLAKSVLKWWNAIHRGWTHGLLGDEWISPGTALDPGQNRYLHTRLKIVVAE